MDDPFSHYLIRGIPCGHSPNGAFDEAFYRVFYPDVSEAIASGAIPCGFYHYIVAGKAEARLPRYDRRRALEARIRGVTKPALLERIDGLRARMQERRITIDDNRETMIWVLLPTMNPDINFGGYRSVFELMRRLHDSGHRVTILCTEDGHAEKSYYLWRETSPELRRLIEGIAVVGLAAGRNLVVGPRRHRHRLFPLGSLCGGSDQTMRAVDARHSPRAGVRADLPRSLHGAGAARRGPIAFRTIRSSTAGSCKAISSITGLACSAGIPCRSTAATTSPSSTRSTVCSSRLRSRWRTGRSAF